MKSDRRITLVTAIATFLGLSAITVVVWALTRPDVPASVAATQAAVVPTQPQDEGPAFERISAEELKAMVDAGAVLVIDVRSAEQYTAAHIKDALHIPVSSIEGEIQYLPKDRLIVTYCTCPAEESSGEAAMILQRHGIPAKALLGGLGAWTTVGYPTAAGVK